MGVIVGACYLAGPWLWDGRLSRSWRPAGSWPCWTAGLCLRQMPGGWTPLHALLPAYHPPHRSELCLCLCQATGLWQNNRCGSLAVILPRTQAPGSYRSHPARCQSRDELGHLSRVHAALELRPSVRAYSSSPGRSLCNYTHSDIACTSRDSAQSELGCLMQAHLVEAQAPDSQQGQALRSSLPGTLGDGWDADFGAPGAGQAILVLLKHLQEPAHDAKAWILLSADVMCRPECRARL